MGNTNKQKIDINKKKILITGAAGFIGAALTQQLMRDCKDSTIIGIDNLNDYYDPKLKEYRLYEIDRIAEGSSCNWFFKRTDIADKRKMTAIFNNFHPHIVVNLAAQAGVRYSIVHPDVYISSNIVGFYNILECCRYDRELEHLIYASSSSVYGGNTKIPFSIEDTVDHPVSLYAATKKSDELMAYSYSKLYNIPSTGLRFFTVYGPAGRPDMAYFSFTEKLRRGENLNLFNFGKCQRDFTFIDDIVDGIVRVIQGAPTKEKGIDGLPIPPYSLYNIGGGRPENLMDFVHVLSEELVDAGVLEEGFIIDDHLNLVPMQPGDVILTYADSSDLERDYNFKPETGLRAGLKKFASWYKDYIEDSKC